MNKHLQSVFQWLLATHPRLTNPEKIQQSKLLSAILLGQVFVLAAILILVLQADPNDISEPTVQGAFLLIGIVLIMYVVNRFGNTSIAALGFILPFFAMFIYIPFYSGESPIFLAFLMVPIILTAIFFSLKRTAIVSIGLLALVAILLTFMDHSRENLPYWNLRNMWYFLMLTTGLVLTFVWHIGNLEQIRQQELKRINQQLEQQIAEMERFTYTISHDLKSPVVTIKGFLGMLKKDIQENRRERIDGDVKRISDAAEKMGTLLSELLELTRIGRIVNPPGEINLVNLTQEAVEILESRIRSRDIKINISPDLPILRGDRIRLREVLENLIDNAAKYMGDQPAPVIEIGTQFEKNERVVFVKDNGIGIDPKYHDNVFGLFNKLDAQTEGAGIGLTLIKRIIEVHGGRIWVESEGLEKGSTFCFTIPSAEISNNKG